MSDALVAFSLPALQAAIGGSFADQSQAEAVPDLRPEIAAAELPAGGAAPAVRSDRELRWVMDGELMERLGRLEAMIALLIERETAKAWYGTDEFARIVGKAEFTVREWCRHGRIRAEKKDSGRGAYASWVISHAELLRYQKEGLIPTRTHP